MGTCLFILGVFFFYSYSASSEYKELKLKEITKGIQAEVEYVNKSISAIEYTAKNIASNAGIIYSEKNYLPEEKTRQYLATLLLDTQQVYDVSGGFGVWFEPYAFYPDKENFAVLVYKDLIGNNLVVKWHDTAVEDYHDRAWYQQLLPADESKNDIYNRKKVFWSMPAQLSFGSETRLITNIGAYIYDNNNRVVGVATIGWQMSDFIRTLEHINISPNSKLLLADIKYNKIVSYTFDTSLRTGDSLDSISWFGEISKELPSLNNVRINQVQLNNQPYYIFTVLTDNNMLLASIVPEQDLFGAIDQKNFNTILILTVFSLATIIFTIYFVNRMLNKPIKKISATVEKWNREFDPQFDIQETEASDEISTLATSFSKVIRHNNMTLKSILDGINNIIYIIDIRTFKLNYVNKHMLSFYTHLDKDLPCYQAFLGRTEPCPFCPVVPILQKPEAATWENHTGSFFKKRVFSLQASIVEWNGSGNHALVSVADISQEVAEKERLEVLAETDALTGVLNRRGGYLALERIGGLQEEIEVAIAMLDLNGLKTVNDTFGHNEGDFYLQALVQAIKKNIRANDQISRLGGDEFLIILPNCNNEIAEKILRRVNFDLLTILEESKKPYTGSFAYGIETFVPEDDLDINRIIDRADQRMYYAKKKYYEKI